MSRLPDNATAMRVRKSVVVPAKRSPGHGLVQGVLITGALAVAVIMAVALIALFTGGFR